MEKKLLRKFKKNENGETYFLEIIQTGSSKYKAVNYIGSKRLSDRFFFNLNDVNSALKTFSYELEDEVDVFTGEYIHPSFTRTFNQFVRVGSKLSHECEDFIQGVLRKQPNFTLDFQYVDGYVSVTYNGGNHPENGNPYSIVNAVFLKHDEIFLSIEDDDEYSFDEISEYEQACVASFIYDRFCN